MFFWWRGFNWIDIDLDFKQISNILQTKWSWFINNFWNNYRKIRINLRMYRRQPQVLTLKLKTNNLKPHWTQKYFQEIPTNIFVGSTLFSLPHVLNIFFEPAWTDNVTWIYCSFCDIWLQARTLNFLLNILKLQI